jgi:hypothetical protein
MPADDHGFEALVRLIARSVEDRLGDLDPSQIADSIGVDATVAREWVETAGRWVRDQAQQFGEDTPFGNPEPPAPTGREEPLPSAEPHPLDLPTGEQGQALAALESGRWTVERGSNALAAHGEGPGPSNALGLVRELRARDWVTTDGELTLVGRHALGRWLEASSPR